jgi:beta-xylosidase
MVFNGRNPSAPIQQTGHADLVVRPDGRWYVVFLAVRPQVPSNINGTWILGRETFLSPVTWSRDGWPLANNGSEITFNMADPYLPTQSIRSTTWSDDFGSSTLDPSWEFRGTPYGAWLHISNSSLILRGTPRTLAALDGMALVVRKQDTLLHHFSVDVEFEPTLESHEAGIVAWINDEYHNTVSVVLCKYQTSAICIKTATIAQGGTIDGNVTTAYHPVPAANAMNGRTTIRLHIHATPDTYQLGYSSQGSGDTTWLTSYPSSWMAPHSGGRISWQGSRMGMYATGNGVPMLQEAVFRHVEVASNGS